MMGFRPSFFRFLVVLVAVAAVEAPLAAAAVAVWAFGADASLGGCAPFIV